MKTSETKLSLLNRTATPAGDSLNLNFNKAFLQLLILK